MKNFISLHNSLVFLSSWMAKIETFVVMVESHEIIFIGKKEESPRTFIVLSHWNYEVSTSAETWPNLMITTYYYCFHQQPHTHSYFLLLVNFGGNTVKQKCSVLQTLDINSVLWIYSSDRTCAFSLLDPNTVSFIHSFAFLSQAPILYKILCCALWIPSMNKNGQWKKMTSYPGSFIRELIRMMFFPISLAFDSPNCCTASFPHFPHERGSLLNFLYFDRFSTYLISWVSFLERSPTAASDLCSFCICYCLQTHFGWDLIWWAICEFWLSRSLVGSIKHLPFIWWCKWPIVPAIS